VPNPHSCLTENAPRFESGKERSMAREFPTSCLPTETTTKTMISFYVVLGGQESKDPCFQLRPYTGPRRDTSSRRARALVRSIHIKKRGAFPARVKSLMRLPPGFLTPFGSVSPPPSLATWWQPLMLGETCHPSSRRVPPKIKSCKSWCYKSILL